MTNSSEPQPFDERSALEELEQLADKIQLSRRQRAQAVAEFDAFVRTFRDDRHAAARARGTPRATIGSRWWRCGRRLRREPVADAGVAGRFFGTSASVPESAPWAVADPLEPIALPAAGRLRAPYVGVGLAALAVVVVAVLMWRSATGPVRTSRSGGLLRRSRRVDRTGLAGAVSAGRVRASTPPPDRRVRSTSSSSPSGPVWTRVTVDGRRALARLIAADERMSFGADQAIAIRAGDAGAFRLVVDGKDLGVLGRDGQIFEKSFSAKTR